MPKEQKKGTWVNKDVEYLQSTVNADMLGISELVSDLLVSQPNRQRLFTVFLRKGRQVVESTITDCMESERVQGKAECLQHVKVFHKLRGPLYWETGAVDGVTALVRCLTQVDHPLAYNELAKLLGGANDEAR